MKKLKEIALLCSVVDNFGDIGVVFRLSRALSQLDKNLDLTLVVSDLNAFSKIAHEVETDSGEQKKYGWTILDWNNEKVCRKYFLEHRISVILECFQCGRPFWLDEILFSKKEKYIEGDVHIVNIEYLTAENWADDFHLLKSGTRSPSVKKINFMPGFTEKTAGLILDEPFMTYIKDRKFASSLVASYFSDEDKKIILKESEKKSVLIFSYERNFEEIVDCFSKYPLHVFLAPGLSSPCFKKAWNKKGRPFILTENPYMQQTDWDALITSLDFLFIRGEDSFSRACLSGRPFIWNIYRQEGEFQIVKLAAFLKRLKPFFSESDYKNLVSCSLNYNLPLDTDEKDWLLDTEVCQLLDELKEKYGPWTKEKFSTSLSALMDSFFEKDSSLVKSFEKFSESLLKNGNLASHLLDYLNSLE